MIDMSEAEEKARQRKRRNAMSREVLRSPIGPCKIRGVEGERRRRIYDGESGERDLSRLSMGIVTCDRLEVDGETTTVLIAG